MFNAKRFRYASFGIRSAVTPTGRAKSPGRVTRASLSAGGRSHNGRPLPIDLACHPKALTPTPVHGGCVKQGVPWGARYLTHRNKGRVRGVRYFTERTWPTLSGRFALYIQGVLRFRTDDLMDAFGWRTAALELGVLCELHSEG